MNICRVSNRKNRMIQRVNLQKLKIKLLKMSHGMKISKNNIKKN